jgi:hypothetical protein
MLTTRPLKVPEASMLTTRPPKPPLRNMDGKKNRWLVPFGNPH